jgi:hypothetical protein
MDSAFLFSLTAALNPVLLTATTVMLLLDHPKRLLLGYLLGALTTSITLGLVIVFTLEDSSAVSSAQNTVNPAVDIAVGAIALLASFVLRSDRISKRRERKAAEAPKGPSRSEKLLSRGSAKVTFCVGAALTLPGASYLAGLHHIHQSDASTAATVAAVVAFNLIMLILLELPLLGYVLAPDWTPSAVKRFQAWLSSHGLQLAIRGAAILGILLVARGLITILS